MNPRGRVCACDGHGNGVGMRAYVRAQGHCCCYAREGREEGKGLKSCLKSGNARAARALTTDRVRCAGIGWCARLAGVPDWLVCLIGGRRQRESVSACRVSGATGSDWAPGFEGNLGGSSTTKHNSVWDVLSLTHPLDWRLG